MTGFLIFGFVLTIFILAGGAFLWWWMDRAEQAGSGKRRHREEARHLQTQLDGDEDFARNFHRPTQNEILEAIQALDHLTPGWELDNDALTYERFKNELAESFPALCRGQCAYPRPIASDVARRFDKAKLSPEALENSLQAHAAEQSRLRSAFHATRAHANARLQMSTGPVAGPVTLTPGSLPFHVSEEKRRSRRPAWLIPAAVAVVLAVLGAGIYLYLNPQTRLGPFTFSNGASVAESREDVGTPAPATGLPLPTPAPSAAPANPEALVAVNSTLPASSTETTEQTAPILPATTSSSEAEAQPSAQALLPPPVAPPPPPTAQTPPTQRVAASQLRAIDKYPDLAVPNSEMNLRFVFRYKNLVEDHSPRLQDPDWPEKLAEECAASIAGPKPKKSTQPGSKRR